MLLFVFVIEEVAHAHVQNAPLEGFLSMLGLGVMLWLLSEICWLRIRIFVITYKQCDTCVVYLVKQHCGSIHVKWSESDISVRNHCTSISHNVSAFSHRPQPDRHSFCGVWYIHKWSSDPVSIEINHLAPLLEVRSFIDPLSSD